MATSGDLKSRTRALLTSAAKVLRENDFIKRGNTYAHDNGHVIQLVDIQYSTWNDVREISFTLNCGVYVRGLAGAFRDSADPRNPGVSDCCINARIGMLTDRKLDQWWKVSEDTAPSDDEKLEEEIQRTVQTIALPFLRRFPDEAFVATFLSQPPGSNDRYVEPQADSLRLCYAAVAWRAAGRSDECQKCVNEAVIRSKETPLASTISAFEKRFRCPGEER